MLNLYSIQSSLDVKEKTDTIVLNSTGLKLGTAAVTLNNLRITEIEHTIHEKEKRVAFKFAEEFHAGTQAVFQVSFSGEILDNQVGYYRSPWMGDGKTKYCALTQFAVRFPHRQASTGNSDDGSAD